MNDGEGKNQETCPLSCESWIMFLNSEIANLENEVQQSFNAAFAVFSSFMVVMTAIVSYILSIISIDKPGLNIADIVIKLYLTYIILSILFALFSVYFVYRIIMSIIINKNVEALKNIRNLIIFGKKRDSNEICEIWRNLMQPNYIELYKLDFFNLRFSISRKAQRRL
ncbi:MAG: hypothetical protein WA102_13975 [Candidatus Methanoperedens sp.]